MAMAGRSMPGDASQVQKGRGHGRPGVAGRNNAGGLTAANQFVRHHHRSLAFALDGGRGVFVHADPFRRRHDFNGQRSHPGMLRQFLFDPSGIADQGDLDTQILACGNRAADFLPGRKITAHGVKGDLHRAPPRHTNPKYIQRARLVKARSGALDPIRILGSATRSCAPNVENWAYATTLVLVHLYPEKPRWFNAVSPDTRSE